MKLLLIAFLFAATVTHAQTRWQLATGYRAESFHTQNIVWFAGEVDRTTAGALRIEVRPNNTLFKLSDIRQAVQAGQVQAGETIMRSLVEAIPIAGKVRNWKARPALSPKLDPRILAVAQRPLFGLDMFQQLQRTRVSLNTHIDISATHASNMRLYEATGVGSCLLTDWKSNIGELFAEGVEVVTYKSAEECVEKVNYLLAHEEERQAIGDAGQRRTLRDHSFDNRAVQLNQIIQTALRQ